MRILFPAMASLGCAGLLAASAVAQNVAFSLNLEFNDPTNLNSGGIWTVVAKADERGLAAAVLDFDADSLNFDSSTGFLTPAGFEVEISGILAGIRLEIVEGDDATDPTLDVGVIGGTYPSTYVDNPFLALLGSNPDLGSFTGGVELATGSFDPGDIPSWYVGPSNDSTAASVFIGTPPSVARANVATTVRYVIPEPATPLLVMCTLVPFTMTRRL